MSTDRRAPCIALYGISPRAESNGIDEGLLPVKRRRTASQFPCVNIVPVKPLAMAAYWAAERDTRIGVVAMGHGAMVNPRMAPAGTPVLVNRSQSRAG